MKIKKPFISCPLAFVYNILLVYAVYVICQLIFLFENWSFYSDGISALSLKDVVWGSLVFDTSAILYTNALYALLMLFPIHFKETEIWQKVAKWIFLIINYLAIIGNLADSVYFKYTGRRTTNTVFQEFSHENNLADILGNQVFSHWYLFVLGIALMIALYYLYATPNYKFKPRDLYYYFKYYALHAVLFVIYIPLTVFGMRGGTGRDTRPITISNANQYVNRPQEAALVLNTPFSIIRTLGKVAFNDPKFFTAEEVDRIYSPIHEPSDTLKPKKKNVVVLIMESYGREYIGYYNKYKGYAPFTDSLLNKSLTFDETFSNGRKSIDGMPSILSSIPRFNEPFFLTPASLNQVSGIAGELTRNWGYYSAFFHGAPNGSMGFEAFAKTTGYKDYYGMTEYCQDKRFHGKEDFDGFWAIWDEEFLQYFALKMSEMKQPFVTSIFTASSHDPYHVPEKYAKIYPDAPGDGNVIHKCIRYVDQCLKEFFETASKQPWYKNTIFVLTADHTNLNSEDMYKTDLGVFCVPILIFDPSGEIQAERRHGIAQQIDIMPTVLSHLGYDKPYVAFGKDLLHTKDEDTWAVNQVDNTYQYVKGDYVLQMMEDGTVKGLYNYKKDWYMKKDLSQQQTKLRDEMQLKLKGIIQSYMTRMIDNQLVVKPSKK